MADFIIVNGRRMPLSSDRISGNEINNMAKPKSGRRTIIRNGMNSETINPYKNYSKSDLIDKKGNPVKIETIPDRTKGSFEGKRSALSKQIITEQVYDLALHYFKSGVNFDEEDANWMLVPKYVLPKKWHHIATATELLIIFPTEYPALPPIGFYMKESIPESPNGHFYAQAYHEADKAPLEAGWKWYCVYVNQGSWQPNKHEWRKGDNLWTYFSLIREVLSSQGD